MNKYLWTIVSGFALMAILTACGDKEDAAEEKGKPQETEVVEEVAGETTEEEVEEEEKPQFDPADYVYIEEGAENPVVYENVSIDGVSDVVSGKIVLESSKAYSGATIDKGIVYVVAMNGEVHHRNNDTFKDLPIKNFTITGNELVGTVAEDSTHKVGDEYLTVSAGTEFKAYVSEKMLPEITPFQNQEELVFLQHANFGTLDKPVVTFYQTLEQ